jgi:hypothetical protein
MVYQRGLLKRDILKDATQYDKTVVSCRNGIPTGVFEMLQEIHDAFWGDVSYQQLGGSPFCSTRDEGNE